MTAIAASPVITPVLLTASAPIEQAIRDSGGHASTTIEGDGRWLRLGYESTEDITLFIMPLTGPNQLNPADATMLVLPRGTSMDVTIDLSVAPSWRPGSLSYLLNLLSTSKDAEVSFLSAEFFPASITELIGIGFRHAMLPEPYSPSSYHALRGQRMFSLPLPIILGIATIILAITIGMYRRSRSVALVIMLMGMMMVGARASFDFIEISREHLTSMLAHGTYDEAGSIYLIGERLRPLLPTGIVICRDGTNFQEKILRYLMYPVPVGSSIGVPASHVVVEGKIRWSFDHGRLRCGDIDRRASHLASFDDGSEIFTLLPDA